ncbi:unnamed protein product, partial [Rotaria sp. Silwood1]
MKAVSLKSLTKMTRPPSCTLEEDRSQLKRIFDLLHEPRETLQPIDDYEKVHIVPLEEAILPLIGLVPDIESRAYVAKQRSLTIENGIAQDESAAICLFTMDWEPQCVYTILNQRLQSPDRNLLKPFFSYLKLLLTAFWRLPSEQKHVLECLNGKMIQDYSYFGTKNEIVLMPATSFIVTNIIEPLKNFHIITMREKELPYLLLEPPFATEAEHVSTVATCQSTPIFTPEEEKQIIDELIREQGGKKQWIYTPVPATDRQMELFANELKRNKDCQELVLAFTSISTIGICYIAEILKVNRRIKILVI